MPHWKTPVITKWGNDYLTCPVRLHSSPSPKIVWRGRQFEAANKAYATPMEFLVARADAGNAMYMDILNLLIAARLGVDT